MGTLMSSAAQKPTANSTGPPVSAADSIRAGDNHGATSGRDRLVGTTVAGRFTILNLIARGGMGKVYRAEQAPLGRICALKVLSPKYRDDEDPEFQRRFFLEASTAAKLTHPNTVTIFDYGRDEDIYYIAMEYIEGRTLYRILREDGPLDEMRTAHVMRQVCRSLREAHGLGVIHRDLKPANVLLADQRDERDIVKVLDFGLVKEMADDKEDLTKQGLFMGSPKYMAPEQILGNPVSPRSDVYSLGVVAYELLAGEVPFDRGTSVKTLMAQVNEAPPPMKSLNPDLIVSAAMLSIVTRCLKKNPDDRFDDMDAVLQALTAVEGGDLVAQSVRAEPRTSVVETSDPASTPPPTSGPRASVRCEADSDPAAPPLSAPPSSAKPEIPDALRVPSAAEDATAGPTSTPAPMAQTAKSMLTDPRAHQRRILFAALVVGMVAVTVIIVAARREQSAPDHAARATPAHQHESTSATTEAAAPAEAQSDDRTNDAAVLPKREVLVESSPAGATVTEDGKVLCPATPCTVAWEGAATRTTHMLTLTKSGHAPAKLNVSTRVDRVEAALVRSVRRPNPSVGATAPTPALRRSKAPDADKKAPKGYKDSPY